MTNIKDQDLDRILKEWASAHAFDGRDREALEQRILSQFRENHPIDTSRPTTREFGGRWRLRSVAVLTATAAALALVTLVVHKIVVRDQLDLAIVGTDAEPFTPALLSWKDADHGKHLLAELQNVFDRKVIWVSEDSKEVSVGVAPSSEFPGPAGDVFVAIRVTLVGRRAASESWKVIDTINVIAGQQETVELAQGSAAGSGVFVWAYPLADGSIAIDLSGWKAGPDKVSISSSNVVKPGQLSTIREYTKDGMEYRVFQATELLKSDDLG